LIITALHWGVAAFDASSKGDGQHICPKTGMVIIAKHQISFSKLLLLARPLIYPLHILAGRSGKSLVKHASQRKITCTNSCFRLLLLPWLKWAIRPSCLHYFLLHVSENPLPSCLPFYWRPSLITACLLCWGNGSPQSSDLKSCYGLFRSALLRWLSGCLFPMSWEMKTTVSIN